MIDHYALARHLLAEAARALPVDHPDRRAIVVARHRLMHRCGDCGAVGRTYRMADGRRLCAACTLDGDPRRGLELDQLADGVELENRFHDEEDRQ